MRVRAGIGDPFAGSVLAGVIPMSEAQLRTKPFVLGSALQSRTAPYGVGPGFPIPRQSQIAQGTTSRHRRGEPTSCAADPILGGLRTSRIETA